MLQLNPQIPVFTPKGKGWAFFVIDRSQEHDLEWVVFLDNNGECWTFKNSVIHIQNNYTLHRHNIDSRDSNPVKSSDFKESGEHNGSKTT
jgi:hypothetical protein